jgi:hypothetical protein
MAATKQKKENKGIISTFIQAVMVNLITLVEVVFKPYYLLPIIGTIIISAALMALCGGILEKPTTDLVLYFDQIPQDNMLGLILFNYPIEFLGLVVLSVLMSIISLIGMISVSRMTKKNGLVNSINESIKDWKKALGTVVIVWVVAILFFIIGTLVNGLSVVNDFLAAIVFIAVAIIGIALLIKAIFVLPAITETETTKEAIALGFEFTDRIGIIKFLALLVFLALAIIVSLIGSVLILQVGIILGSTFDILFQILAEAFATTYFVSAVTNYFYTKDQK